MQPAIPRMHPYDPSNAIGLGTYYAIATLKEIPALAARALLFPATALVAAIRISSWAINLHERNSALLSQSAAHISLCAHGILSPQSAITRAQQRFLQQQQEREDAVTALLDRCRTAVDAIPATKQVGGVAQALLNQKRENLYTSLVGRVSTLTKAITTEKCHALWCKQFARTTANLTDALPTELALDPEEEVRAYLIEAKQLAEQTLATVQEPPLPSPEEGSYDEKVYQENLSRSLKELPIEVNKYLDLMEAAQNTQNAFVDFQQRLPKAVEDYLATAQDAALTTAQESWKQNVTIITPPTEKPIVEEKEPLEEYSESEEDSLMTSEEEVSDSEEGSFLLFDNEDKEHVEEEKPLEITEEEVSDDEKEFFDFPLEADEEEIPSDLPPPSEITQVQKETFEKLQELMNNHLATLSEEAREEREAVVVRLCRRYIHDLNEVAQSLSEKDSPERIKEAFGLCYQIHRITAEQVTEEQSLIDQFSAYLFNLL